MKKNMKKLLAVICAIALLITGSGLELLFGGNGPSKVQAADNYTRIGFEEFGITEEKKWKYSDLGQYGNRSFQASDATKSLHLKEVEGIVNVASGGSAVTYMVFGGPYNNGVTNLQVLRSLLKSLMAFRRSSFFQQVQPLHH